MTLQLDLSNKRVSIRAGEYRGKPGFRVSGYMTGPKRGFWQPSVFTLTRESAEKIRARLLADEPIAPEDWQP